MTRRTDESGVAAFEDLAEAEYVVYCPSRWRWEDATGKVVRLDRRGPTMVETLMPVRARDSYFEIEVRDPHRRIAWASGRAANYRLEVAGMNNTIAIPEHGLAVVEGKASELWKVRLVAFVERVLAPETLASPWQVGVVGQPTPVLIFLP